MLRQMLNDEMAKQRKAGYHVEATPQLTRLLGVDQYRQRDYNKMVKLASDPKKLREYVFAVNPGTGEIISGGAAMARANQRPAAKRLSSTEQAPASETELMVENVAGTIADVFQDTTALTEFKDYLRTFRNEPNAAVSAADLQALHPAWFGPDYRGDVEYGVEEMVRGSYTEGNAETLMEI